MNRRTIYPRELKERAVRLVVEHRRDYPSERAALIAIASKLDLHHETLRVWVRAAENGEGPIGLPSGERERLKELERENRELRRTNEILKAAAAFFGAELDRQPRR
jgi:transposase